MRVIFLDIDGVLNCWDCVKAHVQRLDALPAGSKRDYTDCIGSHHVVSLNNIIQRSGAKIVISSAWRKLNTLEYLSEFLHSHGVQGEFIGMPPSLGTERGLEIAAWLNEHPHPSVESFVILDDSSDMAHLERCLVRTNMESGLTERHVARAVAMFNFHEDCQVGRCERAPVALNERFDGWTYRVCFAHYEEEQRV